VRNCLKVYALAFSILAGLPISASAQARAAQQDEPPTPLRVQIVLSRYQGEKKLSSIPFALSVNVLKGDGGGNLRIGSKIPIKAMGSPGGDAAKLLPMGGFTYQDVGTSIDCRTVALGDGRFSISITLEDTSVYGDDADKRAEQPSFRSFRASNSMILRDGQSGQFTSAVDKVSGDMTKVDVTLTVVK